MAVVRALANGFELVDWTEEVNNVPHQYGLFNGMGLFNMRGTSQTAIIFDKSYHDTTLIPEVSRRSRETTKGNDRVVETFSLPLAYFKHSDYIAPEDIQSFRAPGTADGLETLARLRVQKLSDMRFAVEQTLEWMQLQAAQGITITPNGRVLADMFTEFGVTRPTLDFELGNPETNVDAKIAELKRGVQSGLKTGGAITGIDVIVGNDFFDALVNHPQVRQAYQFYLNSGVQRLRDDLSQYMAWGVVDVFEHRGVRFMTYNASFNLPDGSKSQAVADDEGFILVRGPRDLYRGFFGPSNKLSGANKVGQPMFAYEFTDPRDEFHEMQIETAPLFFATQPQVLYKLEAGL